MSNKEQLDRIENCVNHVATALRENGPGRVECPKCGGVRNTETFVFRPGVNYTGCSNCSEMVRVMVLPETNEDLNPSPLEPLRDYIYDADLPKEQKEILYDIAQRLEIELFKLTEEREKS